LSERNSEHRTKKTKHGGNKSRKIKWDVTEKRT